MKKLIYIFAILLVLSSTIISCKKNEDELLHNITDSEILYKAENVLSMSNGKTINNIKAYADKYYIPTYDTQKGFEQIEIYDKEFNLLNVFQGDIEKLSQPRFRQSAFSLYNNSIYFVYMAEENTMEGRELIQFDLDGKEISRVILDTPEDIWDGRVLDDIYITEKSIVLVSGSGIQICDRQGKTIAEICGEDKSPYHINSYSFDSAGYVYYAYQRIEDLIPYLHKVECSTGKSIWNKQFAAGNLIRNICVDEKSKDVYIQNGYEIQQIDTKTNTVTTLCDIRDYDIVNAPEAGASFYIGIQNLITDNGKIYYLYSKFPDKSDLIKLTPLEGKEKEIALQEKKEKDSQKKVIKLFLPYNDKLIINLLYQYEKENNVIIEEEYYSDSFLNFNIADYLQVVSTRILSDDPEWDIMSTEVIPYIQYSKKGYFADLYSLENGEQLKDDTLYYTNIIEACSNNGSLYYYPMYINYYSISGSSEINNINNLSELYELCISNGKNSLSGNAEYIFSNLFYPTFNNYCRMDYTETFFDREKYIETVKILKDFYKADIYANIFPKTNLPGKYKISREENIYASQSINSHENFRILPVNERSNPFVVGVGYAVMSESPVKNEALDLLMYISKNYEHRYGVYRPKFHQTFESMLDGHLFGINVDNIKPFESAVTEVYESLDTHLYYYIDIYSVVYQQTELYCKDEITAEEAADKIEQAFNIFVKENN